MNTEGFTQGRRRPPDGERRTAALAALLTTLGLALCTVIAATAVSAGIARADAFPPTPVNDGVAIAILLGLFFAGVAGMAAGMVEFRRTRDQ